MLTDICKEWVEYLDTSNWEKNNNNICEHNYWISLANLKLCMLGYRGYYDFSFLLSHEFIVH